MSVAIIVNPRSGGASPAEGRRRAARASSILAAAGADGEVFVTEGRGHGGELATAAVRRGARLVIAWGGDGTVNEVAAGLASTAAAIGIVPSGSGNGLARDLGVSRRPERAIAEALAAPPRTIDAGEMGGRLFVSVAGIGFDAYVADRFDRDAAGRRGLATYVRAAAGGLWRYETKSYRVAGRLLHRVLLMVAANSSQFGNGARIAPMARLDDGALDFVTFEERSRLATIAALPRLFLGGLEAVLGVRTQRIEQIVVESDDPIAFHVDGEPVDGGTRVEVRVRPSALRVCVR